MNLRVLVLLMLLTVPIHGCGGGGGSSTGAGPLQQETVSVTVTPASPTIPLNGTLRLTATATRPDGTTTDVTATATWTSSVPATATVNTSGVVTAVAAGTTVVSAAVGNVTGATTVTIAPTSLVSLAISPADSSNLVGESRQFTATGTFSDNSTRDLTAGVSWTSSDPAVATVSNAAGTSGKATAIAAGSTTITATSGSISAATVLTVTAAGATAFPSLKLTPYASGFDHPLYVTHSGDGSGRIFVLEKRGVIRVIKNGSVLPAPFMDLTGVVKSSGAEQGLLGLAFPPNYSSTGRFYVHYTNQSGVGDVVIARYAVSPDPDVADAATGSTLLTVPKGFGNHNGGQLAFGPDGYLYIGIGDGAESANAQNLSVDLGKILRLDVSSTPGPFAVPAGNPFHTRVWAYGLRNPWRFSFDRGTGDLFIADVGQDLYEEVDFQPSGDGGGENYGWRIMEGMHCVSGTCDTAGLTLPVAEYTHDNGNCSVIGGFVYRGAQYPSLQGIYLYGDLCSGRLWGLRRVGGSWESKELAVAPFQVASFGEDEAGNLYVVGISDGIVYRVEVQ